MLTVTLTTLHTPLLPWIIMLVLPISAPTTYSVSGATSMACATAGLPTLRCSTGSGRRNMLDLPTSSCRWPGVAAAPPQRGALSAAASGGAASSSKIGHRIGRARFIEGYPWLGAGG